MDVQQRLLIGWLLFGGTHILMSSLPVRSGLIGWIGLRGFKGAYSLVAFATLIFLAGTYWGHRHEGVMLFARPDWLRHVTEPIVLLAFLCLGLAHTSKSPATTPAEMTGKYVSTARGIHRITRHPQNLAFFLFGLGHMVSNPKVGDWCFWAGFPVFAVLSAIHQDRRLLKAGPPEFRTFYAETSFIPFLAILQGRQTLVRGEIRTLAVLISLAVGTVVRLVHPYVFGGFR